MSAHDVTIYWRPGCGFCASLRAALGPDAGRAQWRNIWEDPEAAATVRDLNDGNELVPTVVIDGVGYSNPDPALVHEALLE
ncbi:glutaredoxin domain-containing protein [Luteipulveratus sp. YIM 133132]|uniref:Glutaredoxin domain-containing protein n=1 Tax=Luteipulveratus flavus TaxID=3031728 RepID=A0ABT6C947_9MICO|nr:MULTISPECIES: glutaredoxin domain-containing protein [unclassified Luteipulveratus]MDE9366351.1 glutaredoxin domain-containing protein [Luteipulveratus sp. YIM 133132]MDF8265441.1 glutaredoxin domain-containing protein [Luteipulveratus sp. YIM 133296]